MGLAGVDSPGLGRAGLGGRGFNKEKQDSGQGQGGIHQAGAAFRGLRASRPSPPPRGWPLPTQQWSPHLQWVFSQSPLDHPSGPGPCVVSPRQGLTIKDPGEAVPNFTCILAASRLCSLP